MRMVEWVRRQNSLPTGTAVVGLGLAVTGAASYGHILVAKGLGAEQFGGFMVLSAMVFFIGPGFFVPLEQEVGRLLAARRVLGLPGGAVIRRAGALGAALAAGLVAVCLVLTPLMVDRLFRGDMTLQIALILSIGGYCVANLVQGSMSGSNQYSRYAGYLGGEAVIRFVIAIICAIAGAATAGPYGLAFGIAPYLAALPVVWGQRGLLERGPDVPWREITQSLGALLTASVLAQLLVNASPVLVELLAAPEEKAEVGVFAAALIVARVPVFLFQAVQAALLPRLAGLAAQGQIAEFRHGLNRLLALLAGLAVVGTVGAYVAGPWIVEKVFGPQFVISSRTTGMLALGSGAYLMAMALAQANIALGGARRVGVGWAIGVAVYLVVVVTVPGLLPRVEVGYVAAAGTAAVVMAVFLRQSLDRGDTTTEGHLVEAMLDLSLEP